MVGMTRSAGLECMMRVGCCLAGSMHSDSLNADVLRLSENDAASVNENRPHNHRAKVTAEYWSDHRQPSYSRAGVVAVELRVELRVRFGDSFTR